MRDRRIEQQLETIDNEAISPGDLAYTHAILAMCFLPHRQIKGEKIYKAYPNGKASLIVRAGDLLEPGTGEWIEQDIPSGPKARLVLLYMNSYAIQHKTRVVDMGDSLNDFLGLMGVPQGGKNRRAVQQEVHNLAAAHFTIGTWSGDRAKTVKTNIIDEYEVWASSEPRQRTLWPSEAVFSQQYYEVLQHHRVPFDLRAIKALQHSSLKLDLYLYLIHRIPRLKRPTHVTWGALHGAFGPTFARERDFKRHFLMALKEVHAFFPEARVEPHPDFLRLYPSRSPIPAEAPGRQLPPPQDG